MVFSHYHKDMGNEMIQENKDGDGNVSPSSSAEFWENSSKSNSIKKKQGNSLTGDELYYYYYFFFTFNLKINHSLLGGRVLTYFSPSARSKPVEAENEAEEHDDGRCSNNIWALCFKGKKKSFETIEAEFEDDSDEESLTIEELEVEIFGMR